MIHSAANTISVLQMSVYVNRISFALIFCLFNKSLIRLISLNILFMLGKYTGNRLKWIASDLDCCFLPKELFCHWFLSLIYVLGPSRKVYNNESPSLGTRNHDLWELQGTIALNMKQNNISASPALFCKFLWCPCLTMTSNEQILLSQRAERKRRTIFFLYPNSN